MAALAHKAAGTASAAAGGNALGAAAADGYGTAADGVKPVMPLQLILRDNPLGVYTAQRLLQASSKAGSGYYQCPITPSPIRTSNIQGVHKSVSMPKTNQLTGLQGADVS